MKTIDLKTESVSLKRLMALAAKDPIRLISAEGVEFLVSPADEFQSEVELLRRNHEFLTFLDERFRSKKRKSIAQVEERLTR